MVNFKRYNFAHAEMGEGGDQQGKRTKRAARFLGPEDSIS